MSKYAAFVSYSGAADARVASALQSALQRYAKPWRSLRAQRIFRDQASMAANAALWPTLHAALDESEFLILLASEESAGSEGVGRELEYWLEHKDPAKILLVLTSGEIHWNSGSFERSTAVHSRLSGVFPQEPLWVDAPTLRTDKDLSLQAPAMLRCVEQLAPTLRHLDKDELSGEHVRQYRLVRRLSAAAVALLSVLTLVAFTTAVIAVNQASKADKQRQTADQQRALADTQRRSALARQLAAQAQLARDTDWQTALRLNSAAYQLSPGPEAQQGLVSTLADSRLRGRFAVKDAIIAANWSVMVSEGNAITDVSDPAHPKRLGGPWSLPGAVHGVSPDGTLLATIADPLPVQLWSIAHPDQAPVPLGQPLPADVAKAWGATFSPDGQTLAYIGTRDEKSNQFDVLSLWRITDPARPVKVGQIHLEQFAGQRPWEEIDSFSFSGNGKLLAVLSNKPSSIDQARVTLWSLAGPEPVMLSSRDVEDGSDVVLSKDGRTEVVVAGTPLAQLQSGVSTDALDVWSVSDPRTPRRLAEVPLTYSFAMHEVMSADGSLVAVTGDNGVEVWDLSQGSRPVRAATLPSAGTVLSFRPDGSVLATSNADEVRVWNLQDRSPQKLTTVDVRGEPFAWSPDGSMIVTSRGAANDQSALYVLSPQGTRLATLPLRDQLSIEQVDFAGAALVVATGRDQILLIDVSNPRAPRRVGEIDALANGQTATAVSADGATLALAERTDGLQRLQLWDIRRPADPKKLSGDVELDDAPMSVAFSPDRRWLAVGTIGKSRATAVQLWDVSNPFSPRQRSSFAPNGSTAIWQVGFSPDGKLIAVSDPTAEVVGLWSVADPDHPRAAGRLVGHVGGVIEFAFSSDHRTMATTSYDGTIRLWSYASDTAPQEIGPPMVAKSSFAWHIAFSPDATALVSTHDDRAVRLWDISYLADLWQSAPQLACGLAGGGLTRDQWSLYLPDTPYENSCAS